jgi:hypothetical protein
MATRPVSLAARKPAKGAHLTASQKGEAIALWKSGTVTLEDLAVRFNKRRETMGKMLKAAGAVKGSDAADIAAKAAAAVETRLLGDVEVHMQRIAQAKEQHFKMTDGLAKLAWSEIVRARQGGVDIAGLKDLMQTLKLAGDVIGGARKELWVVLGIEEYDNSKDLEDLPELTVRELSQDEVTELASKADIDEMGGEMVPDLPAE